ncbi:MAG TPA: Calx-beta domain-containing protein [Actinokineospora sp.]|jgi:hypothetical protein|nr:Calx-beta domain-containing protein [Actinokineospora sp.]
MKTLVKGLLAVIAATLLPVAPAAHATGCTTAVAVNSTVAHEGSDSQHTLVTFTVTATPSTGCTPSGSVKWATKDGTANTADYVAAQGELQLGTQNLITVYVNRDTEAEPDETFYLVLSNPTTGVVIQRGAGIGTAIVLDDDGQVWGPPVTEIQGGKVCWIPDSCKVSVSISKVANHPVTVKYSTFDITAKGGYDYLAVDNATVTIPAGKNAATITIELMPNEPGEDVEEFGIVISEPSAGTLGNIKSIVTIK